MLFNGVNAVEISWMRRKRDALKMVAYRSLDNIMCKRMNGEQIGHMALRG
jgi:hypothetical protein